MLRKTIISIIGITFLMGFASVALADNDTLLESTIVGLPFDMAVNTGTMDGTIRGVGPGLLPWVASGEVKLEDDGNLKVEVEGLLFSAGTPTGTVGAITHVRASVTCHGAGVVATTAVVPLSAAGDAEIEEVITLPSSCVGPIVLVRVGGAGGNSPLLGPWIAASGF